MTFEEYTQEIYPIEDKVKALQNDPIQQIMNNDSLPYDDICVIDGTLQKAVETSDGEMVPVIELLSYVKEDVEKMPKSPFTEVYFAYMNCVDVEDFSVQQIISLATAYSQRRKEDLRKLENV